MGVTSTRSPFAVSRVAAGVAAGVAALSLLVAGCTGGSSATPSVSPTADAAASSASPSQSASVTASPSADTSLASPDVLEATFPEALAIEDVAGAIAFAERFLQEYHVLMRETPEVFAAVVSDGCSFCASVEDHYAEVAEAGSRLEGGAVNVELIPGRAGLQTDGTWAAEFEIHVDDLVEHRADGSTAISDDGGPGIATVIMSFDGQWRIDYVGAERT